MAAGCEMFVDAVRSRNSEIVRFAVTLSYRDIEASRLNLHEVACSDEGMRNRKGKRGRTAAAFYYILPFISRRFVYRISDNCSRSTFIIDFCLRYGWSFKCINMEILLGNACFSCCHRVWNSNVLLSITSYQMPLKVARTPGQTYLNLQQVLVRYPVETLEFANCTYIL